MGSPMLSSNDEDLDGPLTVSRSAKPENPRNPQGSRRLPLKSRTESDRFERKTEFRPLTGTKCKYSAYGGKLRNLRTIFHQILSFLGHSYLICVRIVFFGIRDFRPSGSSASCFPSCSWRFKHCSAEVQRQ